MLSCGHSFCDSCTFEWLKERSTCPVCRSPTLRPICNIALQQIVDDHLKSKTELINGINDNNNNERKTNGFLASIIRSTPSINPQVDYIKFDLNLV